LDFEAAERRYSLEPAHELTAERLYEQLRALTVFDQVLPRQPGSRPFGLTAFLAALRPEPLQLDADQPLQQLVVGVLGQYAGGLLPRKSTSSVSGSSRRAIPRLLVDTATRKAPDRRASAP
jgi:hypothetical protein